MYDKVSVRTVLIEITNVCNMQCVHCYNSFDREKVEKPVFMPIKNVKYIIEKCARYELDKLYISGGEPLCHPNIEAILHLCGEYPKIYFTITTNGLLLTKKIVSIIEKYENICVQLSVDGLSKDTYEKQRGVGTFSKFKQALNMLINSKIKYLTARTCVTKINYRETSTIYEYLLENNIFPSFIYVNQMGNAAKNWDILALSMGAKIKVLNEINSLNAKYTQNIAAPEPVSTCNFTEKVEVKSLLIKFDGNVAPCQFFYDKSIGNIFEQDIAEILNYDNLHEYYLLAEKRKQILEKSPKCINCKIHSICSYGCIGLAERMGDIMGYDGECSYRLTMCAAYSNGIIPIPGKKEEAIF